MDVNVDMHSCSHGRFLQRMKYDVDVKVDGYCDDYF